MINIRVILYIYCIVTFCILSLIEDIIRESEVNLVVTPEIFTGGGGGGHFSPPLLALIRVPLKQISICATHFVGGLGVKPD